MARPDGRNQQLPAQEMAAALLAVVRGCVRRTTSTQVLRSADHRERPLTGSRTTRAGADSPTTRSLNGTLGNEASGFRRGEPDEVALARQIRTLVLRESKRANVGHIGSALSVADIIAALYARILDPSRTDAERDRFVLSKGHAALALYAALFARGAITEQQLRSYCADGSLLGVHPERHVAGIDFSTGSLGHGLSLAAGAALAARMGGSARPVATPIMFCSATPTLKNRSGYVSAKGSTTVNPRSPVSRTIRSSRAARSTSVRMKALLTRHPISTIACAYWLSDMGR